MREAVRNPQEVPNASEDTLKPESSPLQAHLTLILSAMRITYSLCIPDERIILTAKDGIDVQYHLPYTVA